MLDRDFSHVRSRNRERCAEAPVAGGERRRYPRHLAPGLKCEAAWLGEAERTDDPVELLNISTGGMCFRTRRPIQEGQQVWLELRLPSPMGLALVRCVVRWVQADVLPGAHRVGVEFLESTKGWVGPEENSVLDGERA
jgi:c-di-GMP-binding flagellar brake protein YcgR